MWRCSLTSAFSGSWRSPSPWIAENLSLHLLTAQEDAKLACGVRRTRCNTTHGCPLAEHLRGDPTAGPCQALCDLGLRETATLLWCYGGLAELDIIIGIDDCPERYSNNIFGLPVTTLDALDSQEKDRLDAVLLCLHPRYHARVVERGERHGLKALTVLT